MQEKQIRVTDLKAKEIRCKIKAKTKEGEEGYITVYNIKGEERKKKFEELQGLLQDETLDQDTFNLFYITLISEFTDLFIDTIDVNFLLEGGGNMTSQLLIQEFNDMIYEMQYESMVEQIANVRNLSLMNLAQASVDTMEHTERIINSMKVKESKKKNTRRRKVVNKKIRRR